MANIQNQELFTDLKSEESDEMNGGYLVCRPVRKIKWVRVFGRWFPQPYWTRECVNI